MQNIRVWMLAITLGLVMTGCATGPNYSAYRATLSPSAAGMGRIWFYRHSILFGDAADPYIKLDGTEIGRSIPDCFFQVETTPGTHTVSTTTEEKKEVVVSVTTNADSYIQFYAVPGFLVAHVVPTVMSEADALRGMQGMNYSK